MYGGRVPPQNVFMITAEQLKDIKDRADALYRYLQIENKLIEVQEAYKEDIIYMLLFAVTHFLAICVSAAFIIHLLSTRLKSYIYMRLPWSKKKELFVFFDLSQESLTLAKDIHRKRKSKDYQT